MAWKRIVPSKGHRMGSLAHVTMSIEKKGVKSKSAASLAARIVIAADIARSLGWKPKDKVVVDQDHDARLLRIAPVAPGESTDEAFSLMGTSKGKKSGATCSTVGLRLSLLTLGVRSPREGTSPVPCQHETDGRAIVLTPPAWAWDDWVPPNSRGHGRAQPLAMASASVTEGDAPAVGLPVKERPRVAALKAKPKPTVPRVALPLVEALPKNIVRPTPSTEEQLEAEEMLDNGKGAKVVAEWFGWPLEWTQLYASDYRAALAREVAA